MSHSFLLRKFICQPYLKLNLFYLVLLGSFPEQAGHICLLSAFLIVLVELLQSLQSNMQWIINELIKESKKKNSGTHKIVTFIN